MNEWKAKRPGKHLRTFTNRSLQCIHTHMGRHKHVEELRDNF